MITIHEALVRWNYRKCERWFAVFFETFPPNLLLFVDLIYSFINIIYDLIMKVEFMKYHYNRIPWYERKLHIYIVILLQLLFKLKFK